MAVYATKQDLIDRDNSMLWNFAIDRSTGELNDNSINQALDDADEEINSFLTRYKLPLTSVPPLLNKLAVTMTFYWLADRDQQATELLEKRYQMALTTLREISTGKRDLGLPTADKPDETALGKAELLQDNKRLFTRKSLSGVL